LQISISVIVYAILAVVVLIALGWCVRQIRFLWKKTPEEIADERLDNRKSFWDQWFARKKPVVIPAPVPQKPNDPVVVPQIPVAKRKRLWEKIFKKHD